MIIFFYLFLTGALHLRLIGGVTQDIYWRNYMHGDIPCDAYQGAPGKFIGQFNSKGFDLVGSIYAESGVAVGTYGSRINVEKDVRILCSSDHRRLYWDYIDLDKAHDQQLQDAVKGGFQESQHYQLFIGKAIHEGEWKISKVRAYEFPDLRGLWVWSKNGTHANFRQFFVLKYNITDTCGKQCKL